MCGDTGGGELRVLAGADGSVCAGDSVPGRCGANAALLNRVAGGQLSNRECEGATGGISADADQ